MKPLIKLFAILFLLFIAACSDKQVNTPEDEFFSEYPTRNFMMGFTTWPYDKSVESVDSTYEFIDNYSDVYTEHMDYRIPWHAWINNETLPVQFINEVNGKVARKIQGKKLLLSVSLLNTARNDLALDYDDNIPEYNRMSDKKIEDAYYKHIEYLLSKFSPDYLVIVIEANLLHKGAADKWNDYKLLIKNVKRRIREKYPLLPISESFSLNYLYDIKLAQNDSLLNDMANYMNTSDFIAISFYPFLRNLHTKGEFQSLFDFLHAMAKKKIAFVETSTIAEHLTVPNLAIDILSNETEQNDYLETLLLNAQKQNYEFIIWWCYRDFDALWEQFPSDMKDLGKIWRDTGILNENGEKRLSFFTWDLVYNKPSK